jgi:hypothetical protein
MTKLDVGHCEESVYTDDAAISFCSWLFFFSHNSHVEISGDERNGKEKEGMAV